jgi:hypothetical protein
MKVKELIELLEKEDGEREVILSSDAEGNKYSPLTKDFGINTYVPESTWNGDVYEEEITEEMKKQGYSGG